MSRSTKRLVFFIYLFILFHIRVCFQLVAWGAVVILDKTYLLYTEDQSEKKFLKELFFLLRLQKLRVYTLGSVS